MNKINRISLALLLTGLFSQCMPVPGTAPGTVQATAPVATTAPVGLSSDNKGAAATEAKPQQKIIIYQAFTRLFGNKNSQNIAFGTLQQNGVGKFNDINDAALAALKQLGVSHLWLTGVPHHALVTDYSAYGISADDPDVIKGRAGSPYAVKDYYSVNPDLAVDPAKRMEEFKALLARAHRHGLKVTLISCPIMSPDIINRLANLLACAILAPMMTAVWCTTKIIIFIMSQAKPFKYLIYHQNLPHLGNQPIR